MAAFCNTDGGYLIFGVADRPRRIVGADAAAFPDESDWVNRLSSDFDPEIPFEIAEYKIEDKLLIAIAVERHSQRPVVCKKTRTTKVVRRSGPTDETVTQEGAIYFRKSGQSRPIAHSELRALLEEREDQRLRSFLESVQIMQRIGPERVGVVDVSKAAAPGKTTTLYVSREVAKSLNFIREGQFVESTDEGAPAYVVVGTVQLNEVIERPIEDADKCLPNETAQEVRPFLEEIFGREVLFTGYHLAKLAQHIGIRNGTQTDHRYCIYDTKIKRVYYTRDGIALIKQRVRERPQECLRSFASKAVIAAFTAAA